MKTSVIALVAALAGSVMSVEAETVVWYDFDGLGEAATSVSHGTTIQNKANPGMLDATVIGIHNGETAKTEDTAHMPASAVGYPSNYRICDYLSASVSTNADGAIKFTTPASVSGDRSSNDGGALQVSETSSELSSETFTLELTIRLDPDEGFVKSSGQTFVCKTITASDNALAWELGWVNTQVCLTWYDSNGEGKNCVWAGDLADGEWHHLAFVVTSGNPYPLRWYLDYTDKGVVPFAPRSGTGPLTIGARFKDAPGFFSNLARGVSIGEFRYSNAALTTSKFLKKLGPGTGTLSYVTFDNETANASAAYGSLCDGAFWAGTSSVKPGFSDDVPGAVIRDGQGGPIVTKSNVKSISFNGIDPQCAIYGKSASQKVWDTYFLHKQTNGTARTAGTIEFWMKSSASQTAWGSLVRLMNDTSNVSWNFAFVSSPALQFRPTIGDTARSLVVSADPLDGKWHHIAAVFKPNEEDPDGKTDVITYIDRNEGAKGTFDGQIKYSFDQMTLDMGRKYNGLIDELRISDRALEPEEFLWAENAPGLTIIFR